ncbi:phosphatidate cytidylyltransferase [bacterium]|nr:phosphatidate cytidylyltransferase [bacterium]
MFRNRVITALWGTAVFLFALLFPWGDGLLFLLLLLTISLLALNELFSSLQNKGFYPFKFIAFISSTLFLILVYFKKMSLIPHLLALTLLLSFFIGLAIRRGRNLLRDLSLTFLPILYISGLISYLLLLYSSQASLHPPSSSTPSGVWLCAIVVITNWLNDIGSYFGGKFLGKKHIFPHISPAKTLEGFVLGFISAIVGGTILGILSGLGIFVSLLLSLVIGIFAPLGDLAESAIKRELGIKDFSSILPGHGGILDRFDSLLFSAPASYYLLKLLLVIS